MEKSKEHITFGALISRREQRSIVLLFLCITLLLSILMVQNEAFEAFYEYSRGHEDWELDEVLLVMISLLIALAFSALFASVILVKRMIVMAREQVAYERQLLNGRKQQALGSLVGGLSHSLNNHMLPILTIARMIKDDHPPDSELYQDLDHVQQAAESTRAMLQQVLNFTRQEESDYQNCCVAMEAVQAGLKLASMSIPSSIQLQAEIPEPPVLIPVSRVNVEIILLNLIMNSVDAIKNSDRRSGDIRVSLVLPTSERNETAVILQVEDNGTGLTEEQKQRMFDPFYTTKAVGQGTGLGLSETQGIVSAVGGDIQVESVLGEFTRFTLKFPLLAS